MLETGSTTKKKISRLSSYHYEASLLVVSGEIYWKKKIRWHNQKSSAFEKSHCLEKRENKQNSK